MADYRSEFRQIERDSWWSLPRIIFGALAFVVLLGTSGWVVSILSQPGRVISKTFDADNVINNYEWYHDAYGNYLAKTAQVRQFKKLYSEETDAIERNRLRIEMAAIQQSCRDLSRRYNANATKTNRSIFMGQTAPSSLDAGACE